MSSQKINPRVVKIHRSYTVDETSTLLGVHKGTVRNWINHGLATIDNRRPVLIQGEVLRSFLLNRESNRKHKCAHHEFYCVRCRAPRATVNGMVKFIPQRKVTGRLIGLCCECENPIHRFVSIANLASVSRYFDISLPANLKHLLDSKGLP